MFVAGAQMPPEATRERPSVFVSERIFSAFESRSEVSLRDSGKRYAAEAIM